MPRTEIPTPDDLVAALQSAGTDLVMAAGMVFSDVVSGWPASREALHRANLAVCTARDALAAFERARTLIAA